MDKVMLEIMSEFRTLPYDLKFDVLNFVKNMKEKRPSSGNSNGQQ